MIDSCSQLHALIILARLNLGLLSNNGSFNVPGHGRLLGLQAQPGISLGPDTR